MSKMTLCLLVLLLPSPLKKPHLKPHCQVTIFPEKCSSSSFLTFLIYVGFVLIYQSILKCNNVELIYIHQYKRNWINQKAQKLHYTDENCVASEKGANKYWHPLPQLIWNKFYHTLHPFKHCKNNWTPLLIDFWNGVLQLSSRECPFCMGLLKKKTVSNWK